MGLGKIGKILGPALTIGGAVTGHPEISAIGAGLGAMSGGGGSSHASQTTTNTPAPWEADAKQLWDEFLNRWYGTPTDSEATTASGQSLEPDADSVLNRLRQNLAEKKAAEEAYVNAEQGITNRATGNITGITNRYNQATQPIALKVGNFTTNWTPGNVLRAANQNYRNNISSTGLLQQLAEAQAQRQKNLAQTYTTNAADIDYIVNHLQPLAMQLESMRYGLPSQTQSATLPGDSLLTSIAKGLGLGKTTWDWYNSFASPSSAVSSAYPTNYSPPATMYNPTISTWT